MKILPHDPSIPEEREDEKILDAEGNEIWRIKGYQERAIQKVLDEPSRAALIGDEVGRGKTLIAAEIVLRAEMERVLFIGLPDTIGQWAERLALQSDGKAQLRLVDSSKEGKKGYAALMAGEPGYYFAGIAWLTTQDFRHENKREKVTEADGSVRHFTVWARDASGRVKTKPRKEGAPSGKTALIDRPEGTIGPTQTPVVLDQWTPGAIGPAEEPVAQRARKHLFTFRKMKAPLDGIVFDEAHAVSKHSSIQRRTLLTLAKAGHTWKIAMSATWSGNSFANAWSLPRWLWPEQIPAYGFWYDEWCDEEVETITIRGREKEVRKVRGEKVPGAFVKTLPCYIRNEAAEKAPPPHVVYCDPTPEQAVQYRELQQDMLTWVQNWDGDEEPLVVDIPGALHVRLRMLALAEISLDQRGDVVFAPNAASAKLAPLRGLIDGPFAGQPVAILTDSKKYAVLVTERMRAAGYSAIAYTGDVPKAERKRIREAFIAGECQYLVGTVQSMGTGLDGLQRVCSKVIWASLPQGDPSLETQGLGRFFRPGRTLKYGPFEHVQLLMRGSVDVDTMESLLAKAKAMQASIGREALENAA